MLGAAICAATALGLVATRPVAAGPAVPAALRPGAWDVISTVTMLDVPGVPQFLQRMARGRSKAEHKRLAANQGIDALLAPDPKARCRTDAQQIADGRYRQILTCPQKRGTPMHIVRTGSYGSDGFVGDATVDSESPKGKLHIVLHQQAKRTGA